jgi:hypothetical protein
MRPEKLCALVALVAAPVLGGCAGARTNVVAPTSQYPVSMSRGIRDADGGLVSADRRKVVGHFRDKHRVWGMIWSFVSFSPTTDISAALNNQVAAAKGDGVVNLRVAAAECGMNFAQILNILPFWPGCANITVDGDIIQVPPRGAAEAGASAPPPPASPPPPPASPSPEQGASR